MQIRVTDLVREAEAYQILMHYEPFALWMRRHGFHPENGDYIVVPEAQRPFLGPLPSYVHFSEYVSVPAMVQATETEQTATNAFEHSAHESREESGYGNGIELLLWREHSDIDIDLSETKP